MQSLPIELVWKIGRELNYPDIEALDNTCQYLHQSLDDSFWMTIGPQNKTESSWKRTCRHRVLYSRIRSKHPTLDIRPDYSLHLLRSLELEMEQKHTMRQMSWMIKALLTTPIGQSFLEHMDDA